MIELTSLWSFDWVKPFDTKLFAQKFWLKPFELSTSSRRLTYLERITYFLNSRLGALIRKFGSDSSKFKHSKWTPSVRRFQSLIALLINDFSSNYNLNYNSTNCQVAFRTTLISTEGRQQKTNEINWIYRNAFNWISSCWSNFSN